MRVSSNYIALLNGKIITVDSNDSIAEAVLIAGDRIVAVGSNEEIQALSPPQCKVVDLGGRSVIPGIVDSHTHFELSLNHKANALYVQTPPMESLEQIFNAIAERASNTPKGQWIIARGSFGIQDKVREGRLPTRQELDRVAPEHPVALFAGVHITLLNTFAIETMGWSHETLLPRGASLGRDPRDGELTGVFTEIWDRFPLSPWPYDQMLSALRTGMIKHYVSRGGTSVHELPVSTEGIRAWQELRRSGELPVRLRLYLTHPMIVDLEQFIKSGLQTGFGDDWLSIGGIKLFADGTAYHANLHPMVDLKWSQTELDELIYKAHCAGLQIWTHIQTHKGAEMTITAYEKALARLPRTDHRHRVEHFGDEIIDERLIDRMFNSGLIPITTPQFVYSGAMTHFRLRSLINRGFILPGNTDNAGTVTSDPWHSIWCAVQGKTLKGEVASPGESLTPLEAIRMFTYWAAWGGFEEKVKGSIEPGKLADLVVTGEDPLTIDPDGLRTMPVELVLVGGEVKWSSDAFSGALE